MSALRLSLFIAMISLGACNAAISNGPVFTDSQRSGVRVEDGLWVAEVPKCRFDASLPRQQWPKCAMWLLLKDGKIIEDPDSNDNPANMLIVEGRPTIIQMSVDDREGYGFAAFDAPSTTSRLRQLTAWIVKCGTEEKSSKGSAEIHPFGGFDKNCHPQSEEALRAAASASRPPASERMHWKWLRAAAP